MEAVPQPPALDAELLRGQQQDELLAQVWVGRGCWFGARSKPRECRRLTLSCLGGSSRTT